MDRSMLCVLFMTLFLEAAFCLPSTPKPDCNKHAEDGGEHDCDEPQANETDADATVYDLVDADAWAGTLSSGDSNESTDTIVEGLKKIESGVDELIGQLDPSRGGLPLGDVRA